MKKLKVAFLWHQHQPYYRIENEFVLPWVLLHGTKDYFDIPEVLYEFPGIKQTFNFAPSLSLQIDEYLNKNARDKIQKLTLIQPGNLSDDNKKELIEYFFAANVKNMINPYPRYKQLFDQSRQNGFEISSFSEQDWLDLQVWYNLCWFGYFSSQNSFIKRLKRKGKDFSEEEKQLLIKEQFNVLSQINNQYKKLHELGQIELSCSPMYHPILPLLINSKSAHESLPGINLPTPLFRFSDDAERQINQGAAYFESIFGFRPNGMWPSEGSLSDATLNLLAKSGIKWAASDEIILFNSKKNENSLEKYFPHDYNTEFGTISLLFRDHHLSDKIGFTYSNWNESDAANDFINQLKNIRNSLISSYSEDSLDTAVVSVILDGENCWEYYRDNGIPFLRELFGAIQNDNEIQTVTCSEAIQNKNIYFEKSISNLRAGSWINGNFSIWIGDKEDIIAWNVLSEARNNLENKKNSISNEIYRQALDSLMISEGSDWFWWYGPEHPADNKPIFDEIFRHYIRKSYEILGDETPEILNYPLYSNQITKKPTAKTDDSSLIHFYNQISIDGTQINLFTENASMHQAGEIIEKIFFLASDNNIYLQILLNSENLENYAIGVNIGKVNIQISNYNGMYSTGSNYKIGIDFNNTIISLKISKLLINKPNLSVTSKYSNNLIRYKEVYLY